MATLFVPQKRSLGGLAQDFYDKKKTKGCSRGLHSPGLKEATEQNDHKEITIPQMNLGVAFIKVCQNNSDFWKVYLDVLSFSAITENQLSPGLKLPWILLSLEPL